MQRLSDRIRQDQLPVVSEVADWSLPGAGGFQRRFSILMCSISPIGWRHFFRIAAACDASHSSGRCHLVDPIVIQWAFGDWSPQVGPALVGFSAGSGEPVLSAQW